MSMLMLLLMAMVLMFTPVSMAFTVFLRKSRSSCFPTFAVLCRSRPAAEKGGREVKLFVGRLPREAGKLSPTSASPSSAAVAPPTTYYLVTTFSSRSATAGAAWSNLVAVAITETVAVAQQQHHQHQLQLPPSVQAKRRSYNYDTCRCCC